MTRVAAIQMCSSSVLEENLSIAAILLAEASEKGAKLVVLPEMFARIGVSVSEQLAIREILERAKSKNFCQSKLVKIIFG